MYLPKIAELAAPFASTDSGRETLRVLHIRTEDGQSIVEACDGTVLVQIRQQLPAYFGDRETGEPVLLPAKDTACGSEALRRRR